MCLYIEYNTRKLSKAYLFFKGQSFTINAVYTIVIVLHNSSARIGSAHCTCPAALSGYCNHVTTTLYYMEEFTYSGLHEDDLKAVQIDCRNAQPRK